MALGWIIEVEHPDGALLYAVAVEDALAAEERVRSDLRIGSDRDVRICRPMTALPFDLEPGAIKGPM